MSLRRMAKSIAATTGCTVREAYDALVRTSPEWGTEDRMDAAINLIRREMRCR